MNDIHADGRAHAAFAEAERALAQAVEYDKNGNRQEAFDGYYQSLKLYECIPNATT